MNRTTRPDELVGNDVFLEYRGRARGEGEEPEPRQPPVDGGRGAVRAGLGAGLAGRPAGLVPRVPVS